ncbi:Pyridoxal-dependent decarboxylase domain-containing protein 1 [Irineochytrium annulatum]|nr:Pyridoxal-dependent decarboxylase domain-containing protein 1 [Irineochytrium annulatum]
MSVEARIDPSVWTPAGEVSPTKEDVVARHDSFNTAADESELNGPRFPRLDALAVPGGSKLAAFADALAKRMETLLARHSGSSDKNMDPGVDARMTLQLAQLSAALRTSRVVSAEKRQEAETALEAEAVEWLRHTFGFWLCKHVHIHGSSDFGGNRLEPADVQVLRTATFTCLSQSSRVPSYYYSNDELADGFERKLRKSWSLIGGPVQAKSAKLRRDMLNEDVAKGYQPCYIQARAGTSLTGEMDDLQILRDLADQYGCWLHVEGDQLAILMTSTLSRSPSQPAVTIEVARIADSVTINLPKIFDLEGFVPEVSFFQNVDPRISDPVVAFQFEQDVEREDDDNSLVGESHAFIPPPAMFTMPLCLLAEQKLSNVEVRYAQARELTQAMASKLKSANILILNDIEDVCFVCCARFELPTEVNKDIVNMATFHLSERLPAESKEALGLTLEKLDEYVYLRYEPLRSDVALESQAEHLIEAISSLISDAAICSSALRMRDLFKSEIDKGPSELTYINAELVDPAVITPGSGTPLIPKSDRLWIGLGAIRYIPAYLENSAAVDADVLVDVDNLNATIADTLASTWIGGLFSRGVVREEGDLKEDDGTLADELQSPRVVASPIVAVFPDLQPAKARTRSCIRVATDPYPFSEEQVRRIIDAVYKTGSELERGGEFVERIKEVIRKGILKAEKELKGQVSEELSLLRSLPVLGTVLGIVGVPPAKPSTDTTKKKTTGYSFRL